MGVVPIHQHTQISRHAVLEEIGHRCIDAAAQVHILFMGHQMHLGMLPLQLADLFLCAVGAFVVDGHHLKGKALFFQSLLLLQPPQGQGDDILFFIITGQAGKQCIHLLLLLFTQAYKPFRRK